eukprot:1654467-Alexandrium_andersonii.AAC.1
MSSRNARPAGTGRPLSERSDRAPPESAESLTPARAPPASADRPPWGRMFVSRSSRGPRSPRRRARAPP